MAKISPPAPRDAVLPHQGSYKQGRGWNDDDPHWDEERGPELGTAPKRRRSHMDAYYEGDSHYGYSADARH